MRLEDWEGEMPLMQAPVVLTQAAIEHIRGLDLPDSAAHRIKALLTLEPLCGTRSYPALSIVSQYPGAGLYEMDELFYTVTYGYPKLARIRYFFATTRLILLVLSVEAVGPSPSLSHLTFEALEVIERIAARYAVVGKS